MAMATYIGRLRRTRRNSVQLYTIGLSFVALTGILHIPCAQAFWADETLTGSVEGGKFAHYSLNKAGRVTITVIPKQGDPDVYVGENGTEPDYDLDRHTYQSTTCGVERLVVPSFAVRPIGIGIYGHPSHEYSVYELNVRIDEDMNEYEDLIRGEQSFDMMDDEAYSYDHDGAESRDHYGDQASGTDQYSRMKGRRRLSSPSHGGSTVGSSKGGGSIAGGSGTSGGSQPSSEDATDWEDWEEFPMYNVLLTLLRLFWEMLLTL